MFRVPFGVTWCTQAAIFFAVLGRERKLLSLAKADRGFVGHRPLSGQEGDLNTNSGKGGLD